MESKTNYVVVGIAMLLLIFSLILTIIWLSSGFEHHKYNTYTVYTTESISGLTTGSSVKYNGVIVGYIDKIAINPADPQQIKLTIQVQAGTPITVSTYAKLIMQGITGSTYLSLFADSADLTPLSKTPGAPYPIIPLRPSFFQQLETTMNDLSAGLNTLFTKQNTRNLQYSLAHIEKITGAIASNDQDIQTSIRELPQVMRELQKGMNQFNLMAHDLAIASNQVTTTMKAAKNGVDTISQQVLPAITSTLQDARLVINNLKNISTQMQQNPAVIIRGNAPTKPGPGEK